jgi:ABC-2 type transport system ATP-binding protein
MTAIEATGLSKSYGDIVALRDVSFRVEPGEIIGLLGPNGAGKTTLMRLLTGYLEPDEGTARVDSIDVVRDPLAVQRRIGYLPEQLPLYREMSVQEYLQMVAALREIPDGDRRRLLSDAIHAAGLAGHLTRAIETLSKGYRQRVGIAQAILHRPRLLILDEPTSGLDPGQIIEIRGLVRELSEQATVVLSTHILPEVELTCERVLIIMRGELRADARLAELRATDAAIVAVAADEPDVAKSLARVPGVDEVARLDRSDGYQRWRVVGRDAGDLCPAVFEVVREQRWNISELRSDTRTLEDVFGELAQADAAAVDGPAAPERDAREARA